MKKALSIIKTAFVWMIVLLAVFMMIFTVISVTTFNRNDRSLFGYKMYIVNSDSMAATDFNAGALILVKETDPSTLKDGDIIMLDASTSAYNVIPYLAGFNNLIVITSSAKAALLLGQMGKFHLIQITGGQLIRRGHFIVGGPLPRLAGDRDVAVDMKRYPAIHGRKIPQQPLHFVQPH